MVKQILFFCLLCMGLTAAKAQTNAYNDIREAMNNYDYEKALPADRQGSTLHDPTLSERQSPERTGTGQRGPHRIRTTHPTRFTESTSLH